jgi:hypothetical protein
MRGNSIPHDFQDLARIGRFPELSPAVDLTDYETKFSRLGRHYPEDSS